MYTPLVDIYVVTMQLEREKEVLHLLEESKLFREVKVVTPFRPKVNLKWFLTIFNREKARKGESASVLSQPGAVYHTTSKTIQCQSC